MCTESAPVQQADITLRKSPDLFVVIGSCHAYNLLVETCNSFATYQRRTSNLEGNMHGTIGPGYQVNFWMKANIVEVRQCAP